MENGILSHEEMMARGSSLREGAATIERLDPVLLEGHEPWYLYSIYSMPLEGFDINLGTAGRYFIPPCPEGKEWMRSPTVIPGVVADTYPHFTDKEEYRVRAIPGQTVVDAALGIGPGQNKGEDLRRFGVFASHNSRPSKDELIAAKKSLGEYLQKELLKADQYNASAKPEERASVQSEHFFVAARWLGVKKPWMHESQQMTVCPFCAVGVSPTASKCHGCNEVINQVAYEAQKAAIAKGI